MDKKAGTGVDKSGQKKKRTGFHSGKRLKYAIEIEHYNQKDLINGIDKPTLEGEGSQGYFKAGIQSLTLGALNKWFDRGISKKGIIAVADFFEVPEWLFSDDYSISREEFYKQFRSGQPEAPPPSRKSRLALFPVHYFHQGISQSFSDGMTGKKDVSAGENATTQDALSPDENVDVPWDWDRVISGSHDEAEYHFWVGSRCNDEGKYDQAFFNLEKAIQANTLMNELMCRAYYEHGYSRYKSGDLQNAFQDYLKSLQTELDNPFEDLRFRWYDRANGPETIKDFTELAEAFPDSAVICYFRGLVSLDLGEYDSAVADFGRAIDLEPESGSIEAFHALRGFAFYQNGNYLGAINDFTYSIDKATADRPELLFFRALSYEKLRKTAKALQDIVRCLHADPNEEVFLEKYNALKNNKGARKQIP